MSTQLDPFRPAWPSLFSDLSLIDQMAPQQACAEGLHAWAMISYPGSPPVPDSFGKAMIAIRKKLDMDSPCTAASLTKHASIRGWMTAPQAGRG